MEDTGEILTAVYTHILDRYYGNHLGATQRRNENLWLLNSPERIRLGFWKIRYDWMHPLAENGRSDSVFSHSPLEALQIINNYEGDCMSEDSITKLTDDGSMKSAVLRRQNKLVKRVEPKNHQLMYKASLKLDH